MSWSESGIERMRRFSAYRDLEAECDKLRHENAELQQTVRSLVRMVRIADPEMTLDGLFRLPAHSQSGIIQNAATEPPSSRVGPSVVKAPSTSRTSSQTLADLFTSTHKAVNANK